MSMLFRSSSLAGASAAAATPGGAGSAGAGLGDAQRTSGVRETAEGKRFHSRATYVIATVTTAIRNDALMTFLIYPEKFTIVHRRRARARPLPRQRSGRGRASRNLPLQGQFIRQPYFISEERGFI